MLKTLCCTIIFTTVAALLPSASTAQARDNRTLVWAAIGVGAGAPATGGDGIANIAELVLQKRPHHAALRVLAMHDIDRPTNEIGELSALYGRTGFAGNYPVVFATGLSGVGFFDCPDDDDSCFTFGVPIVAEISRSTKFIGIGFQAFGNINSKALYAGGVLFLKFGKVR